MLDRAYRAGGCAFAASLMNARYAAQIQQGMTRKSLTPSVNALPEFTWRRLKRRSRDGIPDKIMLFHHNINDRRIGRDGQSIVLRHNVVFMLLEVRHVPI